MASNKQLIDQIVVISTELGVEVDTDDMKNADLATLLSDLKAKQKDAENVTQADADADADADAEYSVAKGKSVTSLRGILDSGDEIKPEYLSGGVKALEALIKLGAVK